MSARGSSTWHALEWRIDMDANGDQEPRCWSSITLSGNDRSPEVMFLIRDLDALIARLVAVKEVLETTKKLLPPPAKPAPYDSGKITRDFD
jgi:hypothetical protein